MKQWFKNKDNINTIFSVIPIMISMFLVIFSELSLERLIILLFISILFIIALNFSEIANFTLGKDGIAFEKKKLQELNEEAKLTIDKLNEAIELLLEFNFALLHKDAHFDNVTDFDAIVSFITSSKELLCNMPVEIKEKFKPYIEESIDNALYAFVYKAENLIDKRSVRTYVNYKKKYSEHDITRPDEQFINFVGLRKLSDKVEYVDIVNKLEIFIREFKPELIK